MCIFTHENRQSIINRVYIYFIIQRNPTAANLCAENGRDYYQRKARTAMGVFNSWTIDQISGSCIAEKYENCPEFISTMFQDEFDYLDNDDVAFLIDLEAEHKSAVNSALPYQRFHDPKPFDESFRNDLSQRLDRFAVNEGLKRPASDLSDMRL